MRLSDCLAGFVVLLTAIVLLIRPMPSGDVQAATDRPAWIPADSTVSAKQAMPADEAEVMRSLGLRTRVIP